MSSVNMVRLLLTALVAGVFGIELAVTMVFTALVEVVVELVLLVELILVVLVVIAWNFFYLWSEFMLRCNV